MSGMAPPFPPKSKESPINLFRVGFGWEGRAEVLIWVQMKSQLITTTAWAGGIVSVSEGREEIEPKRTYPRSHSMQATGSGKMQVWNALLPGLMSG